MADEIFSDGGPYFGGAKDEFSSTNESFENNPKSLKEAKGGLFYQSEESWGTENCMSPSLDKCLEEIMKLGEVGNGWKDLVDPKVGLQNTFSLAPLELLPRFGNGFRRLNNGKIIEPSCDAPFTDSEFVKQELSTEEIMRIAGTRFIQSSDQRFDVPSLLDNPFAISFNGLSDVEAANLELAELLLASAEKVGNRQYDNARRLLSICDALSSTSGSPVQRLVCHLSTALRDRVDRETGRLSMAWIKEQSIQICKGMMSSDHILAFHHKIPFSQISHFAGIQAIVENVAEAQKIHIIDLEIRNGQQWIILMQALVSRGTSCPLQLLKISAVGTYAMEFIQNTGKRLTSFAQSMKIPFSFKIIMVSDMLELKEDDFELDPEEKVAVFSEFLLPGLIAKPNRLDYLMQIIKNLNPCIMVITEVEANHNSPDFVNRFIEALFFLSAMFDCLETCMERDDPSRTFIESFLFGEAIRNMVAAEGEERHVRNIKMEVWRAFFARFGMEETDFSMSSLYQAHLVLKKSPLWSQHCTLTMDGKSLIIGWKGTPIHALSVWKFT